MPGSHSLISHNITTSTTVNCISGNVAYHCMDNIMIKIK